MQLAVPATPQIVLGIDPGTLFMGYGLIKVDKNNVSLLEMGVLRLARQKDHTERLRLIYSRIEELIRQHRPTAAAIEAPFFGKNAQSMLKLGRAQGVAIAAATVNGLPTTEYSPNKVKQSITGRGHASKEQVWEVMRRILGLEAEIGESMDATDALAVALCHHFQQQIPEELQVAKKTSARKSKGQSWAAFAAANPERIG
jgi:crossover junction endodeoxyribonuclease RuvC